MVCMGHVKDMGYVGDILRTCKGQLRYMFGTHEIHYRDMLVTCWVHILDTLGKGRELLGFDSSPL